MDTLRITTTTTKYEMQIWNLLFVCLTLKLKMSFKHKREGDKK